MLSSFHGAVSFIGSGGGLISPSSAAVNEGLVKVRGGCAELDCECRDLSLKWLIRKCSG